MMTTRALHWITLLACVGSAGCTHDPSAVDDAEPGGDAVVDMGPLDAQRVPDVAPADHGVDIADAEPDAVPARPMDRGSADAGPADMALPRDWTLPDVLLPPRPSTCPNQRGMIGVPFPDGACYLMDPWPVTRGEYHAALEAGPLRSSHPACEGHESVGPREERADFGRPVYCVDNVIGCGLGEECLEVDLRMPWPPEQEVRDDPMVCVSWCDADAFCRRAAKRLCHARVDSAGPYDPAAMTDIHVDELFNACMAGGFPTFPAGLPSGWNQARHDPLVREDIEVEGGFEDLHGLPVALEWRGPYHDALLGSILAPERPCAVLSLDVWSTARRNSFGGSATFRCCADAE